MVVVVAAAVVVVRGEAGKMMYNSGVEEYIPWKPWYLRYPPSNQVTSVCVFSFYGLGFVGVHLVLILYLLTCYNLFI